MSITKFPISEIFYSLQGEGPLSWNPSIFFRFWWCNLKCTWCDSKYSWLHTEFKKIYTLDQILREIKQWPQCKHIVFTGGEPAMFQQHITTLKHNLPDYTFEIETNGSRNIEAGLFDVVNISYKLTSSWNEPYELMATPERMREIGSPCDYKFVCGSQEDLDEIQQIIEKYGLQGERIYLMPLWTTVESQTTSENAVFVSEACKKYGYMFCLRMHILMYGDKMGV